MIDPITHQFWDCMRLFGLRDRLRCPACGSVGTWKPHGGWLDREDERKVRRWLCKWCGYYRGPEGVRWCYLGTSAWEIWPYEHGNRWTPQAALDGLHADPWRG